MTSTRDDLRNVAIVAHVDHGKTTLVDALLHQSGAFGAHEEVETRVMDSMDLERERGITILAKNTAVDYKGVKINIVDTPGHADFGGEVERSLEMVDGVLLLVDAAEGPLPQTRFVLRKALEGGLPVILVINKVDRPDARIGEVLTRSRTCSSTSTRTRTSSTSPSSTRTPSAAGRAWTRRCPATASSRCSTCCSSTSRRRATSPTTRCRRWSRTSTPPRTSGAWRSAACATGRSRKGQRIGWCRADGTVESGQLGELFVTEALDRVPAESAGPGEIIAVAGLDDVTIGETLADPDDPRPLPVITVDEPSLSITLGVNTSPLAGREGKKVTARQIKARLDRELIGNVSIRVNDTDRPDAWEVQGRGELQLAVLVELMRREGFELTVGQPRVLEREIDGKRHEPVERMSIDVPEDYVGVVTQLLALRKGSLEQMVNHGRAGCAWSTSSPPAA